MSEQEIINLIYKVEHDVLSYYDVSDHNDAECARQAASMQGANEMAAELVAEVRVAFAKGEENE